MLSRFLHAAATIAMTSTLTHAAFAGEASATSARTTRKPLPTMSVTGKEVKKPYAALGSCLTPVPLTKDIVYAAGSGPAAPKLEDLPLVDAVTFPEAGHPLSITWKFTEKVRVGRFVNGDIYVVGPVTVKETDPPQLLGEQVPTSERILKDNFPNFKMRYGQIEDMSEEKRRLVRNGSILNKPMSLGAGWDSRIPQGRYLPKEISQPPYAMKPGDCLFTVRSVPIDEFVQFNNHQPTSQLGAVLTCVDIPLPADAFRPAFHRREHQIRLARNLKRELLYQLPKTAASPIESAVIKVTRMIQLPWIGVTSDWGWCNPAENGPMYGQNMTNLAVNASLILHLDYESKLKEPLLINFVQYGIDLFGAIESGYAGWWGHGGYGSGRKLPIIFAGIMLGDKNMLSLDTTYPKAPFAEMMMVHYGKHYRGYNTLFQQAPHAGWETTEDLGPAAYFEKWGKEKQINISSSLGYRHCCTSVEWVGEAVALRLMRAEKPWNHPAFFDYIERWMKEDGTQYIEYADFLKAHGDEFFEKTRPQKPWLKKVSNPYVKELYDLYWDNLPKPLPGMEQYAK